jgi:predicted DNA-binding transcriptional regulator AlpA
MSNSSDTPRIRIRREGLDRLARTNRWIHPDGSLHQRLMAESVGLSESTIARFLADDRAPSHRPVTDSFVGRLLAATGCSFDELFEQVATTENTELAAS